MTSSQQPELESLSLSELLSTALTLASNSARLNTIDDETQTMLTRAAKALTLSQNLLRARGVFSSNEQLEDVSTQGLAFMTVDFVAAEVVGRLKTDGRKDRLARLRQAKEDYEAYTRLVESYGVLSKEERDSLRRSGARDPAKKREEKIRQYKWEKEVRTRLQTLAQSTHPNRSPPMDDYALILSLLPSSSSQESTSNSTAPSSSSEPESLRPYTISLLSLLYAQSLAQLDSIEQETQLLQSVPDDFEEREKTAGDGRERGREGDDEIVSGWRLDSVNRGGPDGKGELMDGSGKPLRPFTILPSGGSMDERTRLQNQVFQAGHRLPTMSIDEYLENEFATPGRVITGGGQASEDAPTSSEILQLASEQDGTRSATIADDQKREKDENWARFTEENAKGAGNTMNRG